MTETAYRVLLCVFFRESSPHLNHSHQIAFLTRDELSGHLQKSPGAEVAREVPLTEPEFQGKHWVTTDGVALTTEEVLRKFSEGERVIPYSGPHETAADAATCIDSAWGSPDDD